MYSTWDAELRELVESKQWKKVISLGAEVSIEEKCRYLWAWPTETNLSFLSDLLKFIRVSKILSIGCGSGLLEWIISESTGVPVKGVEFDISWWKSSYSPKTFIDISFVGDEITSEFLLKSCASNEWTFALLFCYFNNHEAFVQYLKAYRGKYLIIIGPGNDCGVHTDPKPFEANFDIDQSWILISSCKIDDGLNYMAVYEKIDKNQSSNKVEFQ